MKLPPLLLGLAVLCASCQPPPQVATPATTSDHAAKTPTIEDLEQPKIPVPAGKKVLKTLSENLDGDAEEEQLIFLQSSANLSLPIVVEVADFDVQRKTYYLAWEGELLASAGQSFDVQLVPLIAANQKELVVRGQDESGRPSLDIFRLSTSGSGLGLQYSRIFGQVSAGSLDLDVSAQGFSSVPVVEEAPDPTSKNPLDTIKTVWEWRFQKSAYEIARVEHFRREKQVDAALEKLFAGDEAGLVSFLQGAWVKSTVDKKEAPLILFFDPANRELVFAGSSAQEVYHWQQTIRTLRNGLYIGGENDLISLIKLQLSVVISTGDTVEINSQDNPNWSGTYAKLSESAARSLIGHEGAEPTGAKNPKGVFRNDKGDEFDFEFPEVRLTLGGQSWTAAGAMLVLGDTTVLEVKVNAAGGRGLFKAYSYVLTEESTTSRIVRTIKLQEGRLTIKGWEPGPAEGLRLEQVELLSAGNVNH